MNYFGIGHRTICLIAELLAATRDTRLKTFLALMLPDKQKDHHCITHVYTREDEYGTWEKYTPVKGKPSSKPSCSGSIRQSSGVYSFKVQREDSISRISSSRFFTDSCAQSRVHKSRHSLPLKENQCCNVSSFVSISRLSAQLNFYIF